MFFKLPHCINLFIQSYFIKFDRFIGFLEFYAYYLQEFSNMYNVFQGVAIHETWFDEKCHITHHM